MMPSGFRKFGHLNFINQFSRKHIGRPQHPPTEKVLNFTMTFHDSTKTFFFSKPKNKAEFKNLDDSEILSSAFPGLKISAASTTSMTFTT